MTVTKANLVKLIIVAALLVGMGWMWLSNIPHTTIPVPPTTTKGAAPASIAGAMQSTPATTNLTDKQSLSDPAVEEKAGTKSIQSTDAEPEFVVSHDYRTALAAQKMMEMAINEDITAAWEGLRLEANAKREKANIALIEMQEAKAKFQKAKFEQQTKYVQNGKMNVDENGELLVSSTGNQWDEMPDDIRITGYIKSGPQSRSSAFIQVGERKYSNVTKGQNIAGLHIADLDDDSQCVVLGMGSASDPITQRYCI